MNEIASVAQWLIEFVSQYLYAGVFIGGIICTSLPVLPSEVLFPLVGFTAAQSHMSIFEAILLGIIGGAGATVASIILYFASLKLGREKIVKYLAKTRISEKKIAKAEQWFQKYGEKMVFICRMVPVLRELISIPAGILGMRPAKYLAYTFAGSCIWSVALTLGGYYFGKNIHLF
ncbi:MAG: DedA family protein [Candidatus Nitrosotenuis sp.]